MAAIKVSVNGIQAAIVPSNGLNVISTRIHGNVIDEKFSELDITGGLYGDEPNPKHLIWVNDHEIFPGDNIEICLLEQSLESHQGKTISELFPEQDEQLGPYLSMERILADIKQSKRVRDGFRFHIIAPSGEPIDVGTEQADYSYGLSVLWNWTNPERARFSLTSFPFDAMAERKTGVRLAGCILQLGQKITIQVNKQQG